MIPTSSISRAVRTRICPSEPGPTSASGRPLARIELQTSFAMLLQRFPRMELVSEPTCKPNYIIRGLEGLLVLV
jgi:cytochrome P450